MLDQVANLHPVLFEECYIKQFESIRSKQASEARKARSLTQSAYDYRGVHLFVMVHGFQGNANDMRLLKNNIALMFPEAMFLSSSANEDGTEGDIMQMGVRLAQEVNTFVN